MLPLLYFRTVTCSEWLVLRRFILLFDSKSKNRRWGPCVCNITQQISPHTDKQTTKQRICAGDKQRGKQRDPQRCRLVWHTSSLLPPTAAANFLLNISHLKQTFPPGCLRLRQYVFQHKRGDIMWLPSPPTRQSKITHGWDSAQIWIARRGRSSGKNEEVSLLGIPGLISACPSQRRPDWQAIQLSGSEKERKTVIISIIRSSPASLVDHLLSWPNELCTVWDGCARKAFSDPPAKGSDHNRKARTSGGKKQKEDTNDQTKRCQCLNTRVQSTACARCYSCNRKTQYSTRPIQEAKVASDKCLLWFHTHTFHSTNRHLLVKKKYLYIYIHNGVCSNTKVHFWRCQMFHRLKNLPKASSRGLLLWRNCSSEHTITSWR